MSLPVGGSGPSSAARAVMFLSASAWSLLGAAPPCVDLRGSAEGVAAIEEQLAIGPVKSSTAAGCLKVEVKEEGPGAYDLRYAADAAGGLSAAASAAQIEEWLAGPGETRAELATPPTVRISGAVTVGLAGDEGPWVGAEVRLAGRLGPVSPFLQVGVAQGTTEYQPIPPLGGFDVVALLGVAWPLRRSGWEVEPYLGLGLGHLSTPIDFAAALDAQLVATNVASIRAELGLGVSYQLSPRLALQLKVALSHLPDPTFDQQGPIAVWPNASRPLFRSGLGVHFGL